MSSDAKVADAARNLANSLSRLKATATGAGREKLDGLRNAAGNEVRRRVAMVAAALALYVLAFLAIVFGGVAVILAFPAHPALAAGGVALFFLLLAAACVIVIVRAHRRRPGAAGMVVPLLGLLVRARRPFR